MSVTSARSTGLRERKKQRTRIHIIETALDLCDEQGFENTTIEQIAGAAQVGARTVTRYFATKEEIVLGPLEDYLAATIEELRRIPRGGNELHALRDAYVTVLRHTADGDEVVDFDRIRQMQRILRNSSAVGKRSVEFGAIESTALGAELAVRIDAAPDDTKVRLLLSTWRTVCQAAMDDWSGQEDQSAENCIRVVLATFADFEELVSGPRGETVEG